MVHLYFRVLAPVAGIPGTTANQQLCIHLGAAHNVVLRNNFHIPEGVLYGLLGHALMDGTIEDITPGAIPDAVSEALRLAVGETGGDRLPLRTPSAQGQPAPPLKFRRWRRASSPLRPVP